MELLSEYLIEGKDIVLLSITGRIDGSNYSQLIGKAREVIDDGAERIILDLSACTSLSSAGLFALHNIALMSNRLIPLDQENGWGAFRSMANEKRKLVDRFKIIKTPEQIMQTLKISGLSSLYATYPDMESAVAAFNFV